MKQFRKMLCLLLACAFLLIGCEAKDSQVYQPEDPQQRLAKLYVNAVLAATEQDHALHISYEKTVTVATQTYGETSEWTQEYWGLGTDQFVGRLQQTVTFGDDVHTVEEEDIYAQGKFYQTLNKEQFYGEVTAEEFVAAMIPAQMLEPSLYTLTQEASVITFTEPTAVEAWIAPEEAILISGSGKVTLDKDNCMESAEYAVTYQHGGAEIRLSYIMTVETAGEQPAAVTDTTDYVFIDNLMSAYALEHAYGYLSQVRHLSSHESSLMLSAAAGMSLLVNEQVDTYAVEDEYAMLWESDVSVTDYSTNENAEYNVVQKFKNGTFTTSEDGGEEERISYITQGLVEETVKIYMQDLPGTDTIASTELTYLGSVIYIEYTGTEQMGKDYCGDICEQLFEDADILNNLASAYETKEMTYYLGLDAYSLLPTAFGIQYEGEHTIEGIACLLSEQVDRSFDLACLDTYDTIFEESGEEKEPENKATPLLYKVTGADGQQMWLMGTIHVGDSRTAYLPQQVYDAFDSSDALAVECNVEAFDKQVEEDDDLMAQVSEYYFYADGSTTKDHIETPDLYEDALKLMKATGNYNFNTEYLKAALWSNSIDQFYLQQSYVLSSEKGMDVRLLARAEEMGKPVLEVESVQFQMKMTSDYSDHLQEVQLFSSMVGSTHEYGQSVSELYELWCAGDEAALIEMLNEGEDWQLKEEDLDMTGLTGEDLERAEKILADLDNINARLKELQAEYDKSMSTDRNKGMLEAAVQYLESDQTVFYAVGMAHLLAPDGLVNTLRAAGYTVEPVIYS